MRRSVILLIFFLSCQLSAQQFSIDLYNVDSIACSIDENEQVYLYKNWEFYQTIDNLWNGERINDRCIQLGKEQINPGLNKYGIDLNSIDTSKALFVRYKMENLTDPITIEPNQLFYMTASAFANPTINLDFSNHCPSGLCSGLITILGIEGDNEMVSRRSDFAFTPQNQCFVGTCFVTEKTETNVFEEIIYKIALGPDSPLDPLLFFTSVDFELTWDVEIIKDDLLVDEGFFNGTTYDLYFSDLTQSWWGANYLLVHKEDGFPSIDNQSFTLVTPAENTEEQKSINVTIEDFQGVYYQLFSHLKAGPVLNNDNIFHELNIINNSSDMCLTIIELIFSQNTNFVYKGGHIGFMDRKACLQFRDNSKLVIEESQRLELGHGGIGNVNLRSGSTIEFKKNSNLVFDGNLMMVPYNEYEGDKNVFIDLPYGSSITFGESAKITVPGNDMILYINMLGGVVDMTNLSDDDQRKIQLVYPNETENNGVFNIYPNPSDGQINIFNYEAEMIESISLINLTGQRVFSKSIFSKEKTLTHSFDQVRPGIYLVQLKTQKGLWKEKMVVK